MLDTVRAIETPEGVKLNLTVAGPVVRALAWVIDSIIRGLLYLLLLIVISVILPSWFGLGIFFISIFVVEWFYPVLFEVYRYGQTPGKAAMNIRVLNDDGTPVTWGASMIRNLIRIVDAMPFMFIGGIVIPTYGFGIITMLLNRNFKRMGDLLAGTLVAYASDKRKQPQIPQVAPAPPAFPLTLEEQQALTSYAERRAQLTKERSTELAEFAGELTHGSSDASARLIGIANWIIGKR